MPIVRKVMGDWALHPQHSWYYPPMYTFIKVPNKDDAARLIKGMDKFSENHLSERLAEQKHFKMQPLQRVHFESLEGDLEPATNPSVLHILTQLSVESFSYLSLALLLALGMVQLALPHFNRIMERELSVWTNGGWYLALGTVLVLALMGLINAFFPYLAVTRFDLNHVIKGGKSLKVNLNRGGHRYRKGFSSQISTP